MTLDCGQTQQGLSDRERGLDLSKTDPINAAKASLSVLERAAAVKVALQSNSVALNDARIICLDDDPNTQFDRHVAQALAAPVWKGGCLAVVGGEALRAMWGQQDLMYLLTFEGCTREDIDDVIKAVSAIVKSDQESGIEEVKKSAEDESPWGAFVSSDEVQTIAVTPVLHLGLRAHANGFSMSSLPGGSQNGGTELFTLRMR